MVFKCDLCNISLASEPQFKQHLEGKKHKRLESIKDEREKSSLKSIFVSGLKKDFFIKNIEEHFQKYGKITKIIIDKEKKAYAIIEYEKVETIDAVLKDDEHKINNKLVKVKRRQTKEFVSKIANNSEKKKEAAEKSKQELLTINAFLTKSINFDEQVSKFIEFAQLDEKEIQHRQEICDDLNDLLKNYLKNSKVKIFGSSVTGLATNGSDMDVTVLFDNYLEMNKHKQQKKFIKTIKLKSSYSTSNNSSNEVTSSIEIDNEEEDEGEEVEEEEEEEEEYLTEEKFEEKYKNLINLDLEEQIKIVAKLIQRYSVDLQDIRKITSSRCPIIRFNHEKYKVNCDITLNNYLAVQNTSLIKLLLELEPMLKSLIYVIRYWSKQKGLNGTFKFNSYTIIWLIVFYLQKFNLLPSVDFLAKIEPIENEKMTIHGFNCNFENDVEKVKNLFQPNKSEELKSFNNLLKGFFDFYSNLDFTTNIVLNTRLGLIESAENSLISKKGCINIQDPFDLEHNLASNVNETILERFKSECSQANNILKYCLTPHKQSANEGVNKKCWGLTMLFTRKTPELMAPKEHVNNCIENGIKIKLNLNNNNYDKNIIGTRETEFILYLLNSCLLFNVKKEINNENIEIKRKRIPPVLNQICSKVDSMGLNSCGSPKRLKVGEDGDYVSFSSVEDIQNLNDDDEFKCHETSKVLAVFNVSIPSNGNTWLGRRNARRDLLKQKVEEESLEFEKKVSVKLAQENSLKNDFGENIDFKLFVYLLDDNILNLKFNLIENDVIQSTNKINPKKLMNFTTLIHFLDHYLNTFYQKHFEKF